MTEEDVECIMRHPVTAIGSDGGVSVLGDGVPHPREYGTFARALGRYVRERDVLTLEDAVRKMSSATAQRLGLADRGLLYSGHFADIVALDAERILGRATFEDPHQYAEGVTHLLVNGVLVVDDGRHTGARPLRSRDPRRSVTPCALAARTPRLALRGGRPVASRVRALLCSGLLRVLVWSRLWQPVVKVARHTESGEAPGWKGATREHTTCM